MVVCAEGDGEASRVIEESGVTRGEPVGSGRQAGELELPCGIGISDQPNLTGRDLRGRQYDRCLADGRAGDRVEDMTFNGACVRVGLSCERAGGNERAQQEVLHPDLIVIVLRPDGRYIPANVLSEGSRPAAQSGILFSFETDLDRKSTRLNSSHLGISYAVFCLKK